MTEADLLRCIEAVDKRKDAGRPPKELAPSGANLSQGKSAEATAKIVGTSRRKVERARQVLSDPKEKEEVMAGKKTIHQAAQDAKKNKKKQNQKPRDEKGRLAGGTVLGTGWLLSY